MVVPILVPLELNPSSPLVLMRGYRQGGASATSCVVHVPVRADGPAPGERLGPYELVHVLGEGAMGVVWLARDQRDSCDVALKLLRRELSADEVYGRRFLREARIAADVDHPNLVTIREA